MIFWDTKIKYIDVDPEAKYRWYYVIFLVFGAPIVDRRKCKGNSFPSTPHGQYFLFSMVACTPWSLSFSSALSTQNLESNTTIILWLNIGLLSRMRRLFVSDSFQGIRVQLLLWFIFSFNLLNLVHYSTICITNGIIFISQIDVVSLGHTSAQDKWTLKNTLRWIDQGIKAKVAGTSVMLAFTALVNSLTSYNGLFYVGGLSPVNANVFAISLKYQCDILSSHRYAGVCQNLLGISLLHKLLARCLGNSLWWKVISLLHPL